jgi:hypothetical protein
MIWKYRLVRGYSGSIHRALTIERLADFAPPAFTLIRIMKGRLSGCSFDNTDDLHVAIHGIVNGFDRPKLICVFEELMRTLQKLMGTEGESIWFCPFSFSRFGDANGCKGHTVARLCNVYSLPRNIS